MWIHGRDWDVGILLEGTPYRIPIRSGYLREERTTEDCYRSGLRRGIEVYRLWRWQIRTYLHAAFFTNGTLLSWIWGEEGIIKPTDTLLDVVFMWPGGSYKFLSFITGLDIVYKPNVSELTLVGIGISKEEGTWTLQELEGRFCYFHKDATSKAITIDNVDYNSMGWELHLRRDWATPYGLRNAIQKAVNRNVDISGKFMLTPDVDPLSEGEKSLVFWLNGRHRIVLPVTYVEPELPEITAELKTIAYGYIAYQAELTIGGLQVSLDVYVPPKINIDESETGVIPESTESAVLTVS